MYIGIHSAHCSTVSVHVFLTLVCWPVASGCKFLSPKRIVVNLFYCVLSHFPFFLHFFNRSRIYYLNNIFSRFLSLFSLDFIKYNSISWPLYSFTTVLCIRWSRQWSRETDFTSLPCTVSTCYSIYIHSCSNTYLRWNLEPSSLICKRNHTKKISTDIII